MTNALSIPIRSSSHSSFIGSKTPSFRPSAAFSSSSVRFPKIKACVIEPETGSDSSSSTSMRKVFIVKPNENGFAVILEITSAESVLVRETTMDTLVSTTELVQKEPAKESGVELFVGGKHILSKYLEDDLKKSLGQFDLIKVLHIAGLATQFPWLAQFALGWQFMWFLLKLYFFSSSFLKKKKEK